MALPVNTTSLVNELRSSLNEIDLQIKHIKNDIAQSYPEEQHIKLNVWYWTYGSNGKPVLHDLLVARANILAAIANLQASGAKR